MPEADKAGERYRADTPQAAPGFFLKGSHQLDWGMKNRLARVFNPASAVTPGAGPRPGRAAEQRQDVMDDVHVTSHKCAQII